MNDAFGVTEVQSICNGEYNFSYLFFSRQAMQIVVRVEFPAFTILHHNVEIRSTIIDLVDFDNVGVL